MHYSSGVNLSVSLPIFDQLQKICSMHQSGELECILLLYKVMCMTTPHPISHQNKHNYFRYCVFDSKAHDFSHSVWYASFTCTTNDINIFEWSKHSCVISLVQKVIFLWLLQLFMLQNPTIWNKYQIISIDCCWLLRWMISLSIWPRSKRVVLGAQRQPANTLYGKNGNLSIPFCLYDRIWGNWRHWIEDLHQRGVSGDRVMTYISNLADGCLDLANASSPTANQVNDIIFDSNRLTGKVSKVNSVRNSNWY